MHTVYDLVRLSAARTPDHPAIVDDRTDRALTYRGLMAEIDALARGFRAHGVESGDIVATVLPNVYEHALSLLALHRLGVVPALVNPRLKPEEIAELIKRGRMKGVVSLPAAPLVARLSTTKPLSASRTTTTGALPGARPGATCRSTESSFNCKAATGAA